METLSVITPQLSMSQQKETFSSVQYTAPARHSTPKSSPRLCSGSRLVDRSSVGHLSESRQIVEENRFSLFLTNIDSSATEEEINRMVAQSLGVDETQTNTIKVVKLVPEWKMHHYQQYVSFKISMNVSFKRTALQSETWPAGIMFREFIEQPRRIWTPIRHERRGP